MRIFPAVVVPIVDVFAEDDQLRSRNRLKSVYFLQQGVGTRATGAAFGGEKLNQNGVSVRGRRRRTRRSSLVLGLRGLTVDGRR